MAKKYIVNIFAEDGTHTKSFAKFENGFKYFQSQIGINISPVEVEQRIITDGYYGAVDGWGRSIEIAFREVGTCKVCKQKNSVLYKIRILNFFRTLKLRNPFTAIRT